jgi:hypothetical protein
MLKLSFYFVMGTALIFLFFSAKQSRSSDGHPEWPAYRPKDKMEILLSEKPASRELPNGPALDFLVDALLKK